MFYLFFSFVFCDQRIPFATSVADPLYHITSGSLLSTGVVCPTGYSSHPRIHRRPRGTPILVTGDLLRYFHLQPSSRVSFRVSFDFRHTPPLVYVFSHDLDHISFELLFVLIVARSPLFQLPITPFYLIPLLVASNTICSIQYTASLPTTNDLACSPARLILTISSNSASFSF